MLIGIKHSSWFKGLLIITVCGTISSCKVGPNFHRPAPPNTQRYTALPQPNKTVHVRGAGKAGQSQQMVMGHDIPGEWWHLFHSTQLNRLIQQGIKHNPTLAAATASVQEAYQLLRAQIGESFFPAVDITLNGSRSKTNAINVGFPASNTFSLFIAESQASYILDFFGKERRTVESDRAQLDFKRYEMLATYVSLTADIAASYIDIASLQSQIKTTKELIREETKTLELIKDQYQVGGASEENIYTQQTLLAQTKATLPPLRKNLALAQHTLAILVGKLPSNFKPQSFNLNKLRLPKKLPVSLPSSFVRQRPDILASEALIHEATANVGIAIANFFPQITLTGDYGLISHSLTDLGNSDTNIWSLAAQLLQPFFRGGSLIAQKRAAVAALHQKLADYHSTVLKSFKDVSDALRSIDLDAKTFLEQYRAEAAAKKSLTVSRNQFRVGANNYLNVLTAEENYEQTVLNRIQAQALRYSDTVSLFQALGGGWWNNPIKTASLKAAGELKTRRLKTHYQLPPPHTEMRKHT